MKAVSHAPLRGVLVRHPSSSIALQTAQSIGLPPTKCHNLGWGRAHQSDGEVRPEMGAVIATSASEASPPSRAAGENFEYSEARNANF